jgi:hypothetical protein
VHCSSVVSSALSRTTRSYRSSRRRYAAYGYYQDGFPQLTADGASILIPCYDAAYGAAYAADTSGKTVAVVDAAGRVSTRNRASDAFVSTPDYSYFRSVAAPNGAGPFYLGGVSVNASADSGVRFYANASLSLDGTTTQLAAVAGTADLRALTLYDGVLWVLTGPADVGGGGLFTFGADLPTGLPTGLLSPGDVSLVLPLAGTAIGSPTAFTFQDAASLWVADLAPSAWGQLVLFSTAAAAGRSDPAPPTSSAWAMADWANLGPAATADGAYLMTLTGREERGQGFVLYTCNQHSVYRYVVSTDVATVIATPSAAR